MFNPTYAEIAARHTIWQEYADRYGTMRRDEFDRLSPAQRVAILIEAFGPEPERNEIDD